MTVQQRTELVFRLQEIANNAAMTGGIDTTYALEDIINEIAVYEEFDPITDEFYPADVRG